MPVSPIVVSALIAGPLAFIFGWLICKAYFSWDARQPTSRTRKKKAGRDGFSMTGKIRALETVVLEHEAIGKATRRRVVGLKARLSGKDELVAGIEEELIGLKRDLAGRDQTIESLRRSGNSSEAMHSEVESEMIVLRAERDESLSRIKHLEKRLEHLDTDETDELLAAEYEDGEIPPEELREAREMLTRRNGEIFELRKGLHEREDRIKQLKDKLKEWDERVKPLSEQFQQQRNMIQELRAQLKAATETPPAERRPSQEPIDDLQLICGIGPTLQRKLHEQKIARFQQIAELSESELFQLADAIGVGIGRVQRDEWVRQAQQLQDQKYRRSA